MSTITYNLETAIADLNAGQLVAIPTETVYGLAGNAESEESIKKIFEMKARPISHPLILHIAKYSDLSLWVREIPSYLETLISAFWPGPLTFVLKCKTEKINPLIRANQDTIAIRCPSHPVAQSLLNSLNFPLVAPSANRFGKISPTTAKHVQESFPDEDLLILDGGRSKVGIESTIIDATDSKGYRILRAGIINEEQLKEICPYLLAKKPSNVAVSGNLNDHYQPKKQLYCFQTSQELQEFCAKHTSVYVLSFNKAKYFSEYLGYELPNLADQLAYELYYQLRIADQTSAKIIGIELPPDEATWQGVRERILKAAVNKL